MSQLVDWIGTFASIISVPLAIFFYYKTIDGKYEKVKRELINLFSSYIGTGNKLSLFYISSVINAKLREHNLKANGITANSIIEDLIVEIISNPLLNNEAKMLILLDLEELVHPLVTIPDEELSNKNLNDRAEQNEAMLCDTTLKFGGFITADIIKGNDKTQLSQTLKIIATWVSIVAAILSLCISTGQITEIFKVIDLTNIFSQIILGVIISLLATLIIFLIEKLRRKK